MNYQPTQVKSILTVDNIITVHYFPYTKTFCFDGESHDFWELVIVDSGEITVSETYPIVLKQGEGFLHAPNQYHSIRANNVFSNIIVIAFKCDCKKLYDVKNVFKITETEKFLSQLILSEARQLFGEPLDIVEQKKLTFRQNLPFGESQNLKNSLEMLLISLCRKNDKPIKAEKKTINKLLTEKIISLLEKNLSQKITIDEIAKLLGYCHTHVKKVFKYETGDSIIDYFITLKVNAAKKLISENELTLSQISEMLGFDSLQYFSSTFKKRTNMTPSAYGNSVAKNKLL